MEQAVISSPLGPLTLFAEDGHLTALVYGDYGGYDDLPLFREAKRQLEEYFAGQRHTFSLPMAPDGTEFQCRVWQVLQDIPYGTAIRFTNRSNIKVAFTVNFKASEDHSGLKMKFLENGTAPTLNSAESGTAPSYTLLVTMVGELDRSVTEAVPLGNIVVGVSP